jgi:molybdopterin molybdotransferase
MDGFAVCAADTAGADDNHPVRLEILETIGAGDTPAYTVTPGHCSAIMTGVPLPDGADAVVKVEDTSREGNIVTVVADVTEGEHLRIQGGEAHEGTVLAEAGLVVTPALTGLASSLGLEKLCVYSPPDVGVVITGNEVLPPGSDLQSGKIIDAAGPALRCALERDGMRVTYCQYARDEHVLLRAITDQALRQSDVVLIIGGASMGEYDLVQDVVKELGVEEKFWKAAIKPGKPLWFGMSAANTVFNLPGNPVSVLVTYYLFVRYYLRRISGYSAKQSALRCTTACLEQPLSKHDPRLEFIRGILHETQDGLSVEPVLLRGSAMLSGMARADCLIQFPAEKEKLDKGEEVQVMMLP